MSNVLSPIWAVPAHITGIFQICPHEVPLYMGSRGAGFSIDNTIDTQIRLTPLKNESKITVFYNGQQIRGEVTKKVVSSFNYYLKNDSLEIFHKSNFPLEAGFGTSGAGALGAALCLNDLCKTNLSLERLGKIAHIAEVECSSGLGDVIAQIYGGAEIRVEPGAPGIGEIQSFEWPKDQKILSVFFQKLATKGIISSSKSRERINKTAINLLQHLQIKPTLAEFLRVSYLFSQTSELIPLTIKKPLKLLRKEDYNACMIMLGGSIFIVGSSSELDSCKNYLIKKYPDVKMWKNNLSTSGPKIKNTTLQLLNGVE
ncbi:MAG: pantoate kinase [Asgard group archaeon]|nr:pantoate kinase [Asgard group archaeon]